MKKICIISSVSVLGFEGSGRGCLGLYLLGFESPEETGTGTRKFLHGKIRVFDIAIARMDSGYEAGQPDEVVFPQTRNDLDPLSQAFPPPSETCISLRSLPCALLRPRLALRNLRPFRSTGWSCVRVCAWYEKCAASVCTASMYHVEVNISDSFDVVSEIFAPNRVACVQKHVGATTDAYEF